MPDLVLFQPDIPGNTGTLLRLTACLGVKLHIIEPAGFRLDDTALRRSGMDYIELASMTRHLDWATFETWRKGQGRRLILLTTKTERSYLAFEFLPDDLLMLGRESAGVNDEVAETADYSLTIPMKGEARSINMALSGAMVLGEALRQSGGV
ncbi:MAG: tRNA (cytidine(34)-2'-O)-methyltransferase [Rhizobiaceae bacterium]|nr:tRNA (cytidine(34)-2'-O)-methyltransferase [Rhizobiaceae bacterium]